MGRNRKWLETYSWEFVTAQKDQLAPFCFYNGNTFAAVIRDVIFSLDLPADQAFVVRSLAGHIVAGVADDLEEKEFREFCEALDI